MSKLMRGPQREAPPLPLELIDGAPWMALLEERFGIPPRVFDEHVWHQPNRKLVSIVTRDHAAPLRPEPISIGLPFFRTNLTYPKMTTGATLLFGHHATRHVVALRPEQVDPYYMRASQIVLDEAQLGSCESSGYVIVTFDGVVLGQSVYFVAGEREGVELPHRMQSLYPKAFSNNAHRSALGAETR